MHTLVHFSTSLYHSTSLQIFPLPLPCYLFPLFYISHPPYMAIFHSIAPTYSPILSSLQSAYHTHSSYFLYGHFFTTRHYSGCFIKSLWAFQPIVWYTYMYTCGFYQFLQHLIFIPTTCHSIALLFVLCIASFHIVCSWNNFIYCLCYTLLTIF